MDYLFHLKISSSLAVRTEEICSLSFDVSVSKNIKCFTVSARAVSSDGTARVTLRQGAHAALMTTCITLPWCHYNSAPWNWSVLALWQLVNPPLSSSVSTIPKTICSLGCQNKAYFPATLKSLESHPRPVTRLYVHHDRPPISHLLPDTCSKYVMLKDMCNPSKTSKMRNLNIIQIQILATLVHIVYITVAIK